MSNHHFTRSQGSRRNWEQLQIHQHQHHNNPGTLQGNLNSNNSTAIVDIFDSRMAANTAAAGQAFNVNHTRDMNNSNTTNNFATAAAAPLFGPSPPIAVPGLRRSQRNRGSNNSPVKTDIPQAAAEIDVEEIDCKPKAKGLPKDDLGLDNVDADTDKSCCICLEVPTQENEARVDNCEHIFCFTCIEKWSERENTCPLCKSRFGRIERVHKQVKKRKKGESKQRVKNSKKVKNRDQRSEVSFGTAQIQNILLRLNRARAGAIQDDVERYFVAGGARGFARTEAAQRFNFPAMQRGMFAPMSMQLEFGHDPFDVFIDGDRAMSVEPRFVTFPLNHASNNSDRAAGADRQRSYATNTNVANAGSTVDVPLEIADSDDDDTVEVLNVRRSSRRRR